MPSTDIDGTPILILRPMDVCMLKAFLDSPMHFTMTGEWYKLYRKITKFVEELDNGNSA